MIESVCAPIEGWFPPPHGIIEIRQVFGDIYVSGSQVVGPAWWESHCMVHSGELPGWPHGVYCHRKVLPMLREALRLCVALNDGYQIHSLGCFAPRGKRSSPEQLSVHSWGVAFDINADTNPAMRIRNPSDLARRKWDLPGAWIGAFQSVGFTWGGDFRSYFDPMHMQYCSGY